MNQKHDDIPAAATQLEKTFVEEEVTGVGHILKNARIKKNLSTHEVGQRLYLTNDMIEKIESENFAALPSLTFVKGYLRAYAKLLGICDAEIISKFNKLSLKDKPATMSAQQIYCTDRNLVGKSIRWLGAVVGLVLVIAVAYWFHYEFSNSSVTEVSSANASFNQNNAADNSQVTEPAQISAPLTPQSDNAAASKNSESIKDDTAAQTTTEINQTSKPAPVKVAQTEVEKAAKAPDITVVSKKHEKKSDQMSKPF